MIGAVTGGVTGRVTGGKGLYFKRSTSGFVGLLQRIIVMGVMGVLLVKGIDGKTNAVLPAGSLLSDPNM